MDTRTPSPHSDDAAEKVRSGGYPTNTVIGILKGPADAERAVVALRTAGFLDSEIDPLAGTRAAQALHDTTGRSGIANLMVRIAEHLHVADEEMETKSRYESALRDGGVLIKVDAPTRERRDLAARVLKDEGAEAVNFHGRFTITELAPKRAD